MKYKKSSRLRKSWHSEYFDVRQDLGLELALLPEVFSYNSNELYLLSKQKHRGKWLIKSNRLANGETHKAKSKDG